MKQMFTGQVQNGLSFPRLRSLVGVLQNSLPRITGDAPLKRKGFAFALLCALAPPAIYAAHTPSPSARAALDHAEALDKDNKLADAAAAMEQAIEADPDFIAAHDRLYALIIELRVAADSNKELKPKYTELERQIGEKYREWETRFPRSAGVMYAIGNKLTNEEHPEGRSYLLKAIQLDPDNAKAYDALGLDAQIRGDHKASYEYYSRASELDPKNIDYAFERSWQLSFIDVTKWTQATQEFVRRFPDSNRGAQLLFWLGWESKRDNERIATWEQLRKQFDPRKYSWSAEAMRLLFEAYLRVDPQKGASLAEEMRATFAASAKAPDDNIVKDWDKRVTLAHAFIQVNQRLSAGKADQAMAMLDDLTAEKLSTNRDLLDRLKAQVLAASGKTRQAYDFLLERETKSPTDDSRAALQRYGKQLGKTDSQITAELNRRLDTDSIPAPLFHLDVYASDASVSLDKLKGKVVLVSFWFPGCGPCRREYPHLERVMDRFRNRQDVVFLGINGMREQDGFVVPFMQKTKYTFTPLKAAGGVTDAYKVTGYPSNFLIDRQGRIVYRGFVAEDEDAERVVQRMVESLLAKPGPGTSRRKLSSG